MTASWEITKKNDTLENDTLEDEYEKACTGGIWWDIHEHLPALRKYASQCNHITELGVFNGGSTRAFLMAEPKKLVSIDVIPMRHNVKRLLPMVDKNKTKWEYKQADGLEITIDKTDLLFIDTNHIYEQLIQELNLHADKAQKYIILHDTTTWGYLSHDGSKGLMLAVNNFLQGHPEWVIKEIFSNNQGLLVMARLDSLDKYGLENTNGYSILYRKGTDEYIGWEMFHSDIYNLNEIFPTMPHNPTILDIGAHIGLFSLKAMSMYVGATVYAYEPMEDNFELMQRNIHINGLCESVHMFNFGVAGQAGDHELLLSGTSNAEHSIVGVSGDKSSTKVYCTTLEEILDKLERVDILKMDIEGAEFEVFNNTPSILLDKVDCIVLEYHRFAGNVDLLSKILENANFRLVKSKDILKDHTGMLYFAKRHQKMP